MTKDWFDWVFVIYCASASVSWAIIAAAAAKYLRKG